MSDNIRIGIDCRLWGPQYTGIGRYTENLVRNLQEIDKENEYALFCRKQDLNLIPAPKKWKKVVANVPLYSLKEQIVLPKIFAKESLDLLHVPHFNVPIFYRGKFVVTIHDLLWHSAKGAGTTLPLPLYAVKYLAYRKVLNNAITRSERIIAPSKTVKNDLIKKFKLQSDKVGVIYEGVSEMSYVKSEDRVFKSRNIKKPYLLYIGNLYPHKNVESAVLAVKRFNVLKHDNKLSLVIVSGRNIFTEKFKKFLEQDKAEDFVQLMGPVSDVELGALYKNSEAFIFPTLSEGFGLPGLEAMAMGTPVLCSNISVLHEIYNSAALYFEPKNIEDIKGKVEDLLKDDKLRENLIAGGRQRVKLFSWKKMAEETLAVYKDSAK